MRTRSHSVSPANAPQAKDTWWAVAVPDLLRRLGTDDPVAGLTPGAAAQRLDTRHTTTGADAGAFAVVRAVLRQFSSPITLILLVAAVISFIVADAVDGFIVILIVLASGLLGFWQEHRAGNAVRELMSRVATTAIVRRDGRDSEVPVASIVPGDIVVLSAGSLIPADARLLDADSLLVDESSLTGETFPVEKNAHADVAADAALSGRLNAVFQGSHVVSGTARALVVHTGTQTEFGRLSAQLTGRTGPTQFQRGMTKFGTLLLRLMIVLTVFIFVVNWVLGREVLEALMFAVALAIGLTPQMLPAITSVSLATGARKMARRKVIVKRLDAIEDLGSVSVLCTDKTGTVTIGSAGLDLAADPSGRSDEAVGRLAVLNAGLQTGFANPLDQAVLAQATVPPSARAVGELPYDFSRKRLSVLVDGVDDDGSAADATAGVARGPLLVCKGAFDKVLDTCATVRIDGRDEPLDAHRSELDERFRALSGEGYRVLGLATRRADAAEPGEHRMTADDEQGLTLRGLLCFHDPIKADVQQDIAALRDSGVRVKVITGDNRYAAGHVARELRLDDDTVLTGPEIDRMSDDELSAAVTDTDVYAEVEPAHKARIVRTLRLNLDRGDQRSGGEHGVAYLGDGINDAPALHAADVGISVDTAHPVARDAASVVLLDKSLGVVNDGVRLGRETFANTLKYVRVTTSASFGNMISMAVASIFLPFLPLLPRQVLVLNFLTDLPSMAIASDRVDDELVRRPGQWNIAAIRNFMLVFGLLSAAFDIITFVVLMQVFHTDDVTFRSAWFLESTITELIVLFSMRSARPLFRTRPGRGLVVLSVIVGVFTLWVPYSPLAGVLGLDAVSGMLMAAVIVISLAYLACNELLKRRFIEALHRG
ncbi:magnesium-translocating P-type ATPase [Pseudoclavibacter sp. CFCC 11306]|uniref:magnesium-translocating P-type ATPase n=1 Tax=Pseudoclavibacter sp. CFCC 11306 TaxID=1564493 RepID=UPI001301810E|nr:magnesium-translocating P-type ATPase [Pseudoclavibacter sp. CFCC 11306]KAB1658271.1 magnesium-translocating P-type ATPase [Pseudoclavibacter sp. CFCC 11306]